MWTFVRLVVILALAVATAACVAPASSSPVDSAPGGPATELPSFGLPGSSNKPGGPNPTIEIPPPIY